MNIQHKLFALTHLERLGRGFRGFYPQRICLLQTQPKMHFLVPKQVFFKIPCKLRTVGELKKPGKKLKTKMSKIRLRSILRVHHDLMICLSCHLVNFSLVQSNGYRRGV